MGTVFRTSLFAVFTAFLAFSGYEAQAAPQVLGLMASAGPIPLTCKDGTCKAEFSTYCLQEHRKAPLSGTAYTPAAGSDLALTVTKGDGSRLTLPAGGHITINSGRQFTVVEMSLPEDALKSMGGVAASISIGKLASLIPVPVAGDPDPLSASEIAEFTQAKRHLAETIVDQESRFTVIARKTNRLINALGENGAATEAKRSGLWKQVFGTEAAPATWRSGDRAAWAFQDCKRVLNRRSVFGMRACLEIYHDDAMIKMTGKVWKGLKPGS